MTKKIPTQLVVGLGILLVGAGIVGGEYLLVRWYPGHKAAVKTETLAPQSYRNDDLGLDMQVAAGIKDKVEPFSGGVRIYSPRLWSTGPSLKITSQPNPDQSAEFTPQILAKWQTDGVTQDLPRYHFERTQINHRDAVLIWQYKDRAMVLTARIIAPDHMVEAECTPGGADEDLYMLACDESIRSIKVAGRESPQPVTPGLMELTPEERKPGKH
jgi:hypothetical protein